MTLFFFFVFESLRCFISFKNVIPIICGFLNFTESILFLREESSFVSQTLIHSSPPTHTHKVEKDMVYFTTLTKQENRAKTLNLYRVSSFVLHT